jgi:hypothetical protein
MLNLHTWKTIGATSLAAVMLSGVVQADGFGGTPVVFKMYGVNDEGLNNSQFFRIDIPGYNLAETEIHPIGQVHNGFDIEALDLRVQKEADNRWHYQLFASSGDNDDGANLGCQTGCLYKVSESGELTLVGDIVDQIDGTDYSEVDALAFYPSEPGPTLYGWSQNQGLILIDTTSAKAIMVFDSESVADLTGEAEEPQPEPNKNKPDDGVIEDMTWDNSGTLLYFVRDSDLWLYNTNGVPKHALKKICAPLTGPSGDAIGEIEGLEMLADEDGALLVMGLHRQNRIDLMALDPITCRWYGEIDTEESGFSDIEGIAAVNPIP